MSLPILELTIQCEHYKERERVVNFANVAFVLTGEILLTQSDSREQGIAGD